MNKYIEVLERSYETMNSFSGVELSRLEYLSEYIFDFTTYEDEMAELFAEKMIQVCKAISEKTTWEYIATNEGRMWYLLMVNMPFMSDRIEWGTSIRGAWWIHGEQILDSSGLIGADDKQQCEWKFSPKEWDEFIKALIAFSAKKEPQA